MKLLFIYYIPSGGMDTLNRLRARALKEAGIECHLLYMQPGSGLQNAEDTPTIVVANRWEIRGVLQSCQYDAVIVCTDYRTLYQIRKFGYKGKLIYEIQGLGSVEQAKLFLNSAKHHVTQYADGILIPQTSHLISLTQTIFPKKPTFCFNNCFDTRHFGYERHAKHNAPVVAWVGRIEENKNWKRFLEISYELLQAHPHLDLWMFEDANLGDHAARSLFNQMVLDFHLDQHLTCYTNIPHSQMAKYFSMIGDSGGFLLCTAKVEGFGYAAVEALACNCPVLTNDSDGVRSFIQHDLTGKYYVLEDMSSALVQAEELLANNPLREQLKKNGRELVRRELNPTLYTSHFIDMLVQLRK